ncbi:uncharacterized protein LOC128555157 [Mercenaria mercenaria]|uniref:uncharacterized protein LOC128555157 n=1 Tax=Mercenaria mercenaria TaxID=6596 RepID=UPI00234F1F66|nr:uncharacterized protein LOC128555157 [Mercenaria mercenaria]
MGKGNGDHPPQKFKTDQSFCLLCIFLFFGASVTLSGLSTGMDDGGSFPYPYFFTGFVLAPILLVNLISRWYVVTAVEKKGLTRNNIVEILNKTTCGNHIWPWSCKVGMLWCIPGSILTGLGGVNCGIEENHDNTTLTNDTRTVRNTCYYDIEGVHGEMYKGLATGLVVIHVFSFVYLLLSNCPVHSVLEQIKEDPQRSAASPASTRAAETPSVAQANTRPAGAPAVAPANTGPAGAPANTHPAEASPVVSAATSANNAKAPATVEGGNDVEMKTKVQQLEVRLRELESRDRQVREISVLPPPPTYNELMNSDSYNSSGAHPDNSFS